MNKDFFIRKFSVLLKTVCFAVLILIITTGSSCKTTQKFSGRTELSIFVIDENDKPVNNFEIILKDGAVLEAVTTNQNGFCVFYDIAAGDYLILAQNPGYTDSRTKISFSERNEVFCIKVLSSEYVFDQTELLYEQELYETAIELLKELNIGKNQVLQNVKSFYLAYGFAALKKKREVHSELRKIKAEPPFDDSAQKYKQAIQQMLE
ncbi:MAG: carboxypeptidase regulatory-like domain-containing protein [Treponema sp.]|nr:carboxypeptidase regulatory-like domain-containing protein [Treponema sp.]